MCICMCMYEFVYVKIKINKRFLQIIKSLVLKNSNITCNHEYTSLSPNGKRSYED